MVLDLDRIQLLISTYFIMEEVHFYCVTHAYSNLAAIWWCSKVGF